MAKITIDGNEVTVPNGTTILQAAEHLGYDVPQMCYHPGLDIVGVCRVCLVKVEGMPKLVPSCATEVRDGMEVGLYSPEAEDARKGVIEFWLLNHPLDCPICDQGGECPLQDIAFDYGSGESRLTGEKVSKDKRKVLGPTVILDEERCILCWRCTRFTQAISGSNQLMLNERGVHTSIGTPPGQVFDDPYSGNVVDLCPVGALTTRDFRFRSRVWELGSSNGVSTVDSCGENIQLWSKKGVVERITARPNLAVNDYWISDKTRFDFKFINDPARLTQPLVRVDGQLREVTWDQAASALAQGLEPVMGKGDGQIAGFFTRHLSNEEYWGFQRFFRSHLGSTHLNFSRSKVLNKARANLARRGTAMESVTQIESADVILVLGHDLESTHGAYGLRVRKAVRNGSKLILAGEPSRLSAVASRFESVSVKEASSWLMQLAAAIGGGSESAIAGDLRGAKKVAVLINAADGNGNVAEVWEDFVSVSNLETKVRPLFCDLGGNVLGAMTLGISPDYFPGYIPITSDSAESFKGKWRGRIPGTVGLDWGDALEAGAQGNIQALVFVNSGRPAEWNLTDEERMKIKKARFVAAFDMFGEEMHELAHVIIPTPSFAEMKATYTTQDCLVQLAHENIIPKTPTSLRTLALAGAKLGVKVRSDFEDVFRVIARDCPSYGGLDYAHLMREGASKGDGKLDKALKV